MWWEDCVAHTGWIASVDLPTGVYVFLGLVFLLGFPRTEN